MRAMFETADASDDVFATNADTAAPAFELIDDAQGRFVVDAETGVVSLSHEGWLEREFGEIRMARLRVREASGESYDMALRLRLCGSVPQLVANEFADLDAGAALPSPPPARPAASSADWRWFAAADMGFDHFGMEHHESAGELVLAAPALAPARAGAHWSL